MFLFNSPALKDDVHSYVNQCLTKKQKPGATNATVVKVINYIQTEKKVEEPKPKSEYKPMELKKQPLEDTTNALKDKDSVDRGEPTKRKVTFKVVETATTENDEDKPKKKVARVPHESTREIIDADVESEKWNEQCKQQ